MDRLLAVSVALARAHSADEVAGVILDHGLSTLGARSGLVVVSEGEERSLEVLASRGDPAAGHPGPQRLSHASPLPICAAIRTGEPIVAEALAEDADPSPARADPEATPGSGAVMAVPVFLASPRTAGLAFTFPRALVPASVRSAVVGLAVLCGQALERVRHQALERAARAELERAQEAARAELLEAERAARAESEQARVALELAHNRSSALAEASAILASSLDWRANLESVAVSSLAGLADWCALDIVSPTGELERLAVLAHQHQRASAAAVLERRSPSRAVELLLGEVLRTGEISGRSGLDPRALARSLDLDPASAEALQVLGLGALLAVPLPARGRVLGVITYVRSNPVEPFDEESRRFAELIGRRMGVAVDNARLYEAESRARARAQEAQAALEEADRRKNDFLAALAHELRNPLVPIRNALYLLDREGRVGNERALHMIARQVRHMTRMIDDLLDVSRITRGRMQLEREPVDLTRLVRTTVEDHREILERAGLAIELQVPARPLLVLADSTRLSQALGNLLSNAVKFCDAGGVVSIRLVPVGPNEIELAVKDTGIGIEPDQLGQVFEPFTQVERSLARSRGGLGLGLALVRGVAELHGGRVAATSEGRDRGTEISMSLPFAELAPGPVEASPPSRDVARPLRVLVVEDNVDAAESLAEILAIAEHRVSVARDGETALAHAFVAPPEVVLCDIGLPDLDGYEVARRLRADERTARTYLVALTGYGQAADRDRAREAGFDLHLTKPVDPRTLEETLQRLSLRP